MKLRLTAYEQDAGNMRTIVDIREFQVKDGPFTAAESRTRHTLIGREVLKQLSMPEVSSVMVTESPYLGGK